MDENELIDKLNSLQAQNIALMHGMATLLRNLPLDKEQLRKEYDAWCSNVSSSRGSGTAYLQLPDIQILPAVFGQHLRLQRRFLFGSEVAHIKRPPNRWRIPP